MPTQTDLEGEQLDLFRALPAISRHGTRRTSWPIPSSRSPSPSAPFDRFRAGKITIRVEAVPQHAWRLFGRRRPDLGASQIVEARDGGLKTSRLMAATPYEILTFVAVGTSARDYDRLKAALDRLQSTTVLTSIRQLTERRRHRFSWINEWKETATCTAGVRARVDSADWFYAGVLDEALVLTSTGIISGSPAAWSVGCNRLVRKHGGRQEGGWSFDLIHLHGKSGSSRRSTIFAYDLREIVRRQTLPVIGSS